MITIPVQKQPADGETIDPLVAARRNRDLMRVTVAIVALAIIMVVATFCALQPSPLPPYMP
ncbi:MAG TPA: hypothetical protein VL486_11235 [Verrucomicrobiae bacterium]|nr:hypothetical protein [Verrucomicrobiae bacterium]